MGGWGRERAGSPFIYPDSLVFVPVYNYHGRVLVRFRLRDKLSLPLA